MTTERIEVQRTIAADPTAIFNVLRDPQGHVAIDSSGMLMDATGEPVQAAGDTFVVHMDREALNDYPLGLYDVTVTITTFVPDREIAWTILGQIKPQIGHVYGYTLEPVDDGTLGHVVLRLVEHRPHMEGRGHLPCHLGRRAAGDTRHPRSQRATPVADGRPVVRTGPRISRAKCAL